MKKIFIINVLIYCIILKPSFSKAEDFCHISRSMIIDTLTSEIEKSTLINNSVHSANYILQSTNTICQTEEECQEKVMSLGYLTMVSFLNFKCLDMILNEYSTLSFNNKEEMQQFIQTAFMQCTLCIEPFVFKAVYSLKYQN